MTVASETNRSGPYSGNGVTTVFAYGFRIVDQSHLQVIRTDATGAETTLSLSTDYTVSGVGSAGGGSITLTTALPSGSTVTILRNIPFTQETDLENQGAYYAQTVEDALDLAVMRDQQLAEMLNRAVLIPVTENDPAGTLAAQLAADITRLADSAGNIDTVAGSIAGVNTVANNVADLNTVADNIGAIVAASGSVLDLVDASFTGDGSKTSFILPAAAVSAQNVLVWVGGVRQVPGDDYSVSGAMLTLTAIPGAGVAIDVLVITAVTAQPILDLYGELQKAVNIGRRTVLTTVGQTTYAVSTDGDPLGLTPSNHILIGPAPLGALTYGVDYTVTEAGALVLAFSPSEGDLLHLFLTPRTTNEEAQQILNEFQAMVAGDADRAEAAADAAALYDGPKVDTFGQLAAVTPAMLAVGEYIRVIASGAVYQRVSTGGDLDYSGTGGVRLSVMPQNGVFRAADFGATVTHVEVNRAISAALARHNAGQFAAVELPAGEILMGAPMTVIDRPIAVYGAGWRQTVLKFTTAGQCVTIRDVGFGPQDANDYPASGDVAYNAPQNTRSGVSIRDLHITGNRAIAQEGIVFEGNCDNALIQNVMLTYLRGHGIYMGAPRGTVRGNVRESNFSDVLVRSCGDTGKSAVYVYRAPTSAGNPTQDSSNINTIQEMQIIYPMGAHGLHFYAPETADPVNAIYGFDIDVAVHSFSGGSGDLVRFEGAVSGITGRVYSPVQHQDAQAVIRTAAAGAAQPSAIDLDVLASNAKNILALDSGFANDFRLTRSAAQMAIASVSTSVGRTRIEVRGDAAFVQLEGAVTLAGTAPVVLPMTGSTTGAGGFFGARASLRVQLDGVIGTVSISGGVYTFTPEAASAITGTIPQASAVLSKVLVARSQRTSISGRWANYNREAHPVQALDWAQVGFAGADFSTADLGGSFIDPDKNVQWRTTATRYAYISTAQDDQVIIGATDSGGTLRDLLALRTDDATPRIDAVRPIRFTPQWNGTGPLQIGTSWLWRDLTMQNVLRFKVGTAPTTEQDGTPVSMRVGVPASATAVGAPGWWAADASWFYVYTGDGTTHAWRRVAVASW